MMTEMPWTSFEDSEPAVATTWYFEFEFVESRIFEEPSFVTLSPTHAGDEVTFGPLRLPLKIALIKIFWIDQCKDYS